jgi:predicted transposase YbfD/YdcC
MASIEVPPLAEVLGQIPDFRRARGKRHPLQAVLLLACVAILGGARSESAIAEWGANYGPEWRRRLGLTHARGPSQATIHRLFRRLDVALLEARLGHWAEQALAALPAPAAADGIGPLEGIALDGKTLRGSRKRGAVDTHLLSAVSQRLGVVLGQVAVADKTNEIPTAPELLAQLALTGRVVTVDALLTQTALAETILAQGGDYLMVVKDNQPTLAADLATLFADPDAPVAQAEETALHGGRCEHRRLLASTELVGYVRWPGVQQVLAMERTVVHKGTGEIRTEWAYAVTSLPPARASPAQLLTLWREHWAIENKLHYVRDVTFDEDRASAWRARIPQVMAALRNAAIGLARLTGQTNIAAACRHFAAQPAAALAALGLSPGL